MRSFKEWVLEKDPNIYEFLGMSSKPKSKTERQKERLGADAPKLGYDPATAAWIKQQSQQRKMKRK